MKGLASDVSLELVRSKVNCFFAECLLRLAVTEVPVTAELLVDHAAMNGDDVDVRSVFSGEDVTEEIGISNSIS